MSRGKAFMLVFVLCSLWLAHGWKPRINAPNL